jgi:hypothetical protein
MDQNYAQKLNAEVQAIFDQGPGIDLPQWPAECDEAAYNTFAAKALGRVFEAEYPAQPRTKALTWCTIPTCGRGLRTRCQTLHSSDPERLWVVLDLGAR